MTCQIGQQDCPPPPSLPLNKLAYMQEMLEDEPPSPVFMPIPTSSESTTPLAPGLAVLPRNLWPHNFLVFSIIMTVIMGIVKLLTLIITIPATVLAGRVRDKQHATNIGGGTALWIIGYSIETIFLCLCIQLSSRLAVLAYNYCLTLRNACNYNTMYIVTCCYRCMSF